MPFLIINVPKNKDHYEVCSVHSCKWFDSNAFNHCLYFSAIKWCDTIAKQKLEKRKD